MPPRKGVVTLSSLCVRRIAWLLIDIIKCLSQCSASKKKKALANQKTEEKDRGQKYEESNENTACKTELQELTQSSSSVPELLESNGFTQTSAADQTEESTSIHTKEDEEKKRKKQEG